MIVLSVGQRAAFVRRQLATRPPYRVFRPSHEPCIFPFVVLVVGEEALNCLVADVVFLIDLRLQDVKQKPVQLKRFWEMVEAVIVQYANEENSLPVLRNSVVLRVEDLPIVRISVDSSSLVNFRNIGKNFLDIRDLTFSSKKYFGFFIRTGLRNSHNRELRVPEPSSPPFCSPALEKSWQGELKMSKSKSGTFAQSTFVTSPRFLSAH